MQTPTTTTRDASGAALMIWSMIPGTPTHSKTTGPLGVAPAASAARSTCPHGSIGTLRSLPIVSEREVEEVVGVGDVAALLEAGPR